MQDLDQEKEGSGQCAKLCVLRKYMPVPGGCFFFLELTLFYIWCACLVADGLPETVRFDVREGEFWATTGGDQRDGLVLSDPTARRAALPERPRQRSTGTVGVHPPNAGRICLRGALQNQSATLCCCHNYWV